MSASVLTLPPSKGEAGFLSWWMCAGLDLFTTKEDEAEVTAKARL